MKSLFLTILFLSQAAIAAPWPTVSCKIAPVTYELQNQKLTLPVIGPVVEESHLVTKTDVFPKGRKFAVSQVENIKAHLQRSCSILKRTFGGLTDCSSVYHQPWQKEWTPAEGGKIGQGSVGDLRPLVEEEMWSGNMFWTAANKPKPGTRFLASYEGRDVVFVMGYETGPRSDKYIAGLQTEVLYALKANSTSKITISLLEDQTLQLGPVVCLKEPEAK